MKTTLEIPDPLFRKIKSTAAMKGVTLKEFFTEAVKEKLEPPKTKSSGWRSVTGILPKAAAKEIDAVVNALDFRTIDAEDWE